MAAHLAPGETHSINIRVLLSPLRFRFSNVRCVINLVDARRATKPNLLSASLVKSFSLANGCFELTQATTTSLSNGSTAIRWYITRWRTTARSKSPDKTNFASVEPSAVRSCIWTWAWVFLKREKSIGKHEIDGASVPPTQRTARLAST